MNPNCFRLVPRSIASVGVRNFLQKLTMSFGVICFGIWTGVSLAQDETSPEESAPAPAAVVQEKPQSDGHPDAQSDAQLKAEKRRKAMEELAAITAAGFAAIGGIAILGVGTIVIVMLWARRLRRLARDLGPAQTTTGNDFWFLKPPKPVVSERDLIDQQRQSHAPPSTQTPETPE